MSSLPRPSCPLCCGTGEYEDALRKMRWCGCMTMGDKSDEQIAFIMQPFATALPAHRAVCDKARGYKPVGETPVEEVKQRPSYYSRGKKKK